MMCDININYFNIIEKDNNIIFTPKPLILDVVCDYSNLFIPFITNERYYIYQEIVFQLMELYEEHFPYLNIQIKISYNTHKYAYEKIPHIIVSNVKEADKDIIIQSSNQLMTNYINKKFSLFI
jgi:hypothetical protein